MEIAFLVPQKKDTEDTSYSCLVWKARTEHEPATTYSCLAIAPQP